MQRELCTADVLCLRAPLCTPPPSAGDIAIQEAASAQLQALMAQSTLEKTPSQACRSVAPLASHDKRDEDDLPVGDSTAVPTVACPTGEVFEAAVQPFGMPAVLTGVPLGVSTPPGSFMGPMQPVHGLDWV